MIPGMRFTAELESTGGSTAGFRVPDDVVESLGGGKRPKVTATLNGYSYRTSIAPMGGEYWLGVAQAHRGPAAVEPGNEYEVEVELDTAPREVEVPPELAAAFEKDPAVAAAWAALSYSNQRRLAEPIAAAKAEETRARRIEKVLGELRG